MPDDTLKASFSFQGVERLLAAFCKGHEMLDYYSEFYRGYIYGVEAVDSRPSAANYLRCT